MITLKKQLSKTHTDTNFKIGTIGHVAHGKSTVVKALSGVQVQSLINLNINQF